MTSTVGDPAASDDPTMGADEQPQNPPGPPPDTVTPDGLGRWLELAKSDPVKCAQELVREFNRQDPAMTRRKVYWDRNTFWWWGYVGIRALPQDAQNIDRSPFRLYVPLGTFDTQPPMPRAKMLAQRQTAHLFADEPMPDPEPASDSDDDRDAAEFTKRLLLQEASESGQNYPALFTSADLRSSIFGSAFTYSYVDPQAGGQNADGSWNPKLCGEVLDGRSVRFLPETTKDLAHADGVLILLVKTLGQLKGMFPNLRPDSPEYIGNEAVIKMVQWRSQAMWWVMPWYAKMGYSQQPVFTEKGAPADSTLVGCIVCYYQQHPAYPKGAYIVAGGDATILYSGTWVREVPAAPVAGMEGMEGGESPSPTVQKLDIPLSQFRQHESVVDGDPYGVGMIQDIGPADEVRNSVTIGGLDHIDRFLRPNYLVPMGSRLNPEEWAQRLGIPIEYNAQNGEPHQEAIGNFDPFAEFMSEQATNYQDQASDLMETAQGTELPSVTSGKQANIVIQQAQENLSGRKQRLRDAITRHWRVMLQQIAAFYPSELKLKYATEDGAYTEKAFNTASLTSVRDVKIAVGSFSQMSPAMKVNMAVSLSQIPGMIADPSELQRIVSTGIQPLLGLNDDPVVLRVRGQLAKWKDGPDAEWLAAYESYDAAMQQLQSQIPPGAPPEAAQAFMADAPAQMGIQPPPSPFDDVPSDHEQDVAVLRHREIRRVTQTKAAWRWPKPWQDTLFHALEIARRDAGIMTVEEQAAAAQAQAEAAMQQKSMELDAKAKDREDKQDFAREQAGDSAKNRVKEKFVDASINTVMQNGPQSAQLTPAGA